MNKIPPTSPRPDRSAHLWMMALAGLALTAVFLIQDVLARRLPAEAVSTLEPVLSPPGGYYGRDVRLRIGAPYPGARVIYTLDGSVPTHTVGVNYTGPIRLDGPGVAVVRARTILPDRRLGPVVSASYFVGVSAELPIISLIIEPRDLWHPESGIYANPQQSGDAGERAVEITYLDPDHRSGFHVPAGVRIHGRGSRDYEKKSLRLYFRQEYGAARLDYPLFAGSEVRSFKRLVLHSGGQDYAVSSQGNWTLLRNPLAARLAFELDAHAAHSRPALLFINGEPWGIYHVRERIDDFFLADHYAIQTADLLEAPESPTRQQIASGDRESWDHLMAFVESQDLADPANYAYVETQADLAEFIDYNVLQLYAADRQWPFHNLRQFRPRVQGGRWHWIFWDSEDAFGSSRYGLADSNMVERVLDYDHPETGGRDALLLRKLLENPAFRERFLARAADLLNTTLSPPSVVAHVDALARELATDVARESARWPGAIRWESNVEALRDFARRRPDFLRQHLAERFELGGVAELSFNPPDEGRGYVAINGTLRRDLPWRGIYFRGLPIQVTAAPAPGYRFVGWEPAGLARSPVITLTPNADQTITPRFAPLGEDEPRPGDVVFGGQSAGESSHLEEDWIELRVMRPGGVDLRGWRVTDEDTKTATNEGSLIFPDDPALAHLPRGTAIRLVVPRASSLGGAPAPQVEVEAEIKITLPPFQRILRGVLPPIQGGSRGVHFNLGPNDNLVLLAPGPTEAFDDDRGIAFVSGSSAVTPASFGVLADGVLPDD